MSLFIRSSTPRIAGLVILATAFALNAAPDALTDLFIRAKAEFRNGEYEKSLATLKALDEASRPPGLAASREKLEPAIAFYRGANLAALGRDDEAAEQFRTYLASPHPAVRLDPSTYPRRVVDVYARVRAETTGAPAGTSGLAEEYARFRVAPDRPGIAVDERWAASAIRFLLTPEEKEAWSRIQDSPVRAEFVSEFWRRRDPTPEGPENEFRDEIERRVQFADGHFRQGEAKGSETDRGMVFVLMGPPTYAGQQPLKAEQDPIQAARAAPLQELVTNPDGSMTTRSVAREGLTAERLQGTREVWHYRRDRLPKAIGFGELEFQFLTKEGYGVAVLQRDSDVLTALEIAARPGRTAPH
jgi:GWxTD domain-containing protein